MSSKVSDCATTSKHGSQGWDATWPAWSWFSPHFYYFPSHLIKNLHPCVFVTFYLIHSLKRIDTITRLTQRSLRGSIHTSSQEFHLASEKSFKDYSSLGVTISFLSPELCLHVANSLSVLKLLFSLREKSWMCWIFGHFS